jgi:hypothetical protein
MSDWKMYRIVTRLRIYYARIILAVADILLGMIAIGESFAV